MTTVKIMALNSIVTYLLLLGSGENNNSKIIFTEDSNVNVGNPDRGFYDSTYALDIPRDYNMFQGLKDNNYTLVYAPINLDDYAETASLPDTLLDTIDGHLVDAENEGIKLIFRLSYRSSAQSPDDPSKEIILGHLNQLTPMLQARQEIFSVIQVGSLGPWGEWHTFTGDFDEANADYKLNRKEIVEKFVDIFPQKYVQIRTPMHKELLFGASASYADESGEAEITPGIAFTQDIKAKIGHHNDCFLASDTDMGTYPSDNIDFWKDYVVNDTKYAPVGGETCKDEAIFTTCTNAVAELKKFQYSYINHAYHPDVIQRWKDEGCYQEIKENLGYRLVANELSTLQSSDSLDVMLSLTNKGYASPYIKSEVSFILKNELYTYEFLQDEIDLRSFYAQDTKIVDCSLPLAGVESGEYCLYLQIGKNYSAIRLSNSGLWDENSKINKLRCGVVVE